MKKGLFIAAGVAFVLFLSCVAGCSEAQANANALSQEAGSAGALVESFLRGYFGDPFGTAIEYGNAIAYWENEAAEYSGGAILWLIVSGGCAFGGYKMKAPTTEQKSPLQSTTT